jgi:hypothetical protein
MLIEPLQVVPGATAVLGRCCSLTSSTYRIHLPCGLRQHRFERVVQRSVLLKGSPRYLALSLSLPSNISGQPLSLLMASACRMWCHYAGRESRVIAI